jgi:hypothetical protein
MNKNIYLTQYFFSNINSVMTAGNLQSQKSGEFFQERKINRVHKEDKLLGKALTDVYEELGKLELKLEEGELTGVQRAIYLQEAAVFRQATIKAISEMADQKKRKDKVQFASKVQEQAIREKDDEQVTNKNNHCFLFFMS